MLDGDIEQAHRAQCLNNMKQIGAALAQYSEDHQQALPNKLDDLLPYVVFEEVFHCPSAPITTNASYVLTHQVKLWNKEPNIVILTEAVENHREGRNQLHDDGRTEFVRTSR